MAEWARARSDLCKQAATVHLKAQMLEEVLCHTKAKAEEQMERVKDEAVKEEKKLEAELAAAKVKVKDVKDDLKAIIEGKIGICYNHRT